jgi:hypothetical protein
MRKLFRVALLFAAGILSVGQDVSAVVLHAKPQRNTAAPKGSLANSGWQWQGRWGKFLGTAIAPRFFMTAEHVGGSVGESLVLDGVYYKTIATWDDPHSDLQIWKVKRKFPTYATIFKRNDEAARGMVTFGRGTQRGDEVVVNDELKGWLWGELDHVQSWGKNVIGGVAPGMTDEEAGGKEIAGGRIWWSFDRPGGSHESTLTSGDSGGGVFVKVKDQWRLVGINHSSEAEFSYPDGDGPHMASLFDVGGLRAGDMLIEDTLVDNPAKSYATRVSTRWNWIFSVVNERIPPSDGSISQAPGVPEPGAALSVLLVGLLGVTVRCRGET